MYQEKETKVVIVHDILKDKYLIYRKNNGKDEYIDIPDNPPCFEDLEQWRECVRYAIAKNEDINNYCSICESAFKFSMQAIDKCKDPIDDSFKRLQDKCDKEKDEFKVWIKTTSERSLSIEEREDLLKWAKKIINKYDEVCEEMKEEISA